MKPMFLGNLGMMELFILFVMILIPTVLCAVRAKKLNRSVIVWGILGFFLNYIALLVIYIVKPEEDKRG